MKVIVAGFPKTGTKSLNLALSKLGYKVYDFLENVFDLEEDYTKLLREGWTTRDFKRMYDDVDAIVDLPAMYYWEEIHKAFPDAKVILSIRDSEEVWFTSFKKQMDVADSNIFFRFLQMMSPTWRRATKNIMIPTACAALGLLPQSEFRLRTSVNKSMLMMKYRAHNALVKNNTPADKLLIYQCKEGWKPLCDFLGVDEPDEPFPHKNVRGSVIEETLREHPIAQKLAKEALITSSILFILIAAICYAMFAVGWTGILDLFY